MLFFLSFVVLFLYIHFLSSSRLTRMAFFAFFHIFFDYHSYYTFFSFVHFFLYSLFASLRLSHMNFFLLLSFFLQLRFALFTGDLTLFELVSSFSWFITNFAFHFYGSWKIDCWIIVSAICEISSEVKLTTAVRSNEFCGVTR